MTNLILPQKSTRIETTFSNLKIEGRTALLGFVVAGDPTPEATPLLVHAILDSGVDIMEIGIPFSDPAAEGDTIRKANERAMKHNVCIDKVLEIVTEIRRSSDKPIVLLTYYNPVFRYGLQKFADACTRAGVDGLIVPDLPFEESGDLRKIFSNQSLHLITMVSPLSKNRFDMLLKDANGFLYCISSLGTTGMREHIQTDMSAFINQLQARPDLPKAIGFGISTPEQAKSLKKHADGIIIGSAIVDCIAKKSSLDESLAAVSSFISSVREALDA